MIHSKKFLDRFRTKGIGVGGWNCPCCGPSPRERTVWVRKQKRGTLSRWVKKYIDSMLQDPAGTP